MLKLSELHGDVSKRELTNIMARIEKIQREGISKARGQMLYSLAHYRRQGFALSVCVCIQALDEKRYVMNGNRAQSELHDEKAQCTLRAGEWSEYGYYKFHATRW